MAAGSRPAAMGPAALAVFGPLCAACGGGPVGTAAGPLVLRGVTVIDGSGSPPLAGQTLVIMDGRVRGLAHSLVRRADSAAFVEFFQANAGFDPGGRA